MKARRILALVLVFVSLLSMVPVVSAAEGETYVVEIQYLYDDGPMDGQAVAASWQGSYGKGTGDSRSVSIPSAVGYEYSYISTSSGITANVANGTLSFSFESIDSNEYIYVHYVPADVNFTVTYYQQNVSDDKYTAIETVTMTGKTGDPISDYVNYADAKILVNGVEYVVDGSYGLWFDSTATIAADGTTAVEVYFDREYYLMTFDLGGGYGVDPIYARYGAKIGDVGTPVRPGYTFTGWDKTIAATMPAENVKYTAQWEAQTVNYTVVFWYENADDANYSFAGSTTGSALAGSAVNGATYKNTNFTGRDNDHFTYNEDLTDSNVTVAGDGTTIVNVYFTRNQYTINFYGYGPCAIDGHTHNDECKDITCDLEEHTHGEDCLTCGQTAHNHTTDCWDEDDIGNRQNNPNNYPNTQTDGYIYRTSGGGGGGGGGTRYYIYIDGSWYRYEGNTDNLNNGSIVNPECNTTEHAHVSDCYDCGTDEHTHTEGACYELICEATGHVHDEDCASTDDDDLLIYTLTAKYEQTIGDIWPTSTDVGTNPNGQALRGWTVEGESSEFVSKRITMTDSMCDTGDDVKTATANYGGTYSVTLYYMFESFDQTSDEDEPDRKEYDSNNQGVAPMYYDKSTLYFQEDVPSGSTSFSQKEITGMTAVGVESDGAGDNNNTTYNNYLYYIRNSYQLSFYNYNGVVNNRTSSVKFEKPLSSYNFTPDYPSGLETGVYEFAGWYTTAGCYEGSEVNWNTLIMPAKNLQLYAKWAPIKHDVKVYMDDTLSEQIGETQEVSHRAFATAPETPTNGNLAFVGWFYKDGEVEKAFDFASMQITKDMEIYAKWKATNPVAYTVNFLVKDSTTKVADSIEAMALPFTTVTADAKVGEDLYTDYQSGWFPVLASSSITISAEGTNVINLYYMQAETVPYTVKYLNAETNEPVADEKHVDDNTKSVVTENAVIVSGFLADAPQKRLIVSIDPEENVLIFWYTEDTEHAYIQETHYKLPADQDLTKAEIYSDTYETGDIGTDYTYSEKSIPGYALLKVTINGVEWTGEGDPTATLTSAGLHFEFYYIPDEFYIHHQSGADTETVSMNNVDADGTYNIAGHVAADYLYGGHYNSDYSTALTESGLDVTPVAGDHYYLKEVDNEYLSPRIYYIYDTRDDNKLVSLYMMTGIDDLNYQYVGFDVVDGTSDQSAVSATTVFESIEIKKFVGGWEPENLTLYETMYLNPEYMAKTGKNTHILYGSNATGSAEGQVNSGYVYVSDIEATIGKNQSYTFTPYWVTPDGVKVTGVSTRTYTTNNGTYGTGGLSMTQETHASAQTAYAAASVEPMMLSVQRAYTLMGDVTYEITKVDGRNTTTQTVPYGNYTGTVEYDGKTGYYFAGWYTDKAYKNPADFSEVSEDMTVYAKYISKLNVTTSLAKSGNTLKASVSVPSGDFVEAGFKYSVNGKAGSVVGVKSTANKGLLSILLGIKSGSYKYDASWTVSRLTNGQKVTITPYWVTADGTVVYGQTSTYQVVFGLLIKR